MQDEKVRVLKDLIRSILFYGIVNQWELEKLKSAYEFFDIPDYLVNETLNEGSE